MSSGEGVSTDEGGSPGGEQRSFVELARRENRAALEAAGVPAFAYRYERTHTAAEALDAYEDAMGEHGPRVSIAGRIDAIRSQGKTAFFHLEDATGRIQIYLRRDALGERWALVERLDLDDHIGVAGTLFRTKKGEMMQILTIEDEEGLLESTLFPATYQAFGSRLRTVGPYVVEGRIEEDHRAINLNVSRVEGWDGKDLT